MDKNLLLKLGLNDGEIAVYLSLVKLGVQTIKQISEAASVNRTTCYRYLEGLEKKGLIEWVVGERGKLVQATSPDNLNFYLRNQKVKLAELEGLLPNMISELKLIKPSVKLATQVRYFEGEDGLEQIIWNCLKATCFTRSYAGLNRREFIDPSFEDEFEIEFAGRGLSDHVITNEGREEYIKNRLIPVYKETLTFRIISPKKIVITNDIIIYNNIMAIMSLEKDNLVGVEIENSEIARNQKAIFDIVWNVAKPL